MKKLVYIEYANSINLKEIEGLEVIVTSNAGRNTAIALISVEESQIEVTKFYGRDVSHVVVNGNHLDELLRNKRVSYFDSLDVRDDLNTKEYPLELFLRNRKTHKKDCLVNGYIVTEARGTYIGRSGIVIKALKELVPSLKGVK